MDCDVMERNIRPEKTKNQKKSKDIMKNTIFIYIFVTVEEYLIQEHFWIDIDTDWGNKH